MTAFRNHRFCESFQRLLIGHIADKPVARLLINDMDNSTFPDKCICDSPADSVGSASNDSNLSFKHHGRSSDSLYRLLTEKNRIMDDFPDHLTHLPKIDGKHSALYHFFGGKGGKKRALQRSAKK